MQPQQGVTADRMFSEPGFPEYRPRNSDKFQKSRAFPCLVVDEAVRFRPEGLSALAISIWARNEGFLIPIAGVKQAAVAYFPLKSGVENS